MKKIRSMVLRYCTPKAIKGKTSHNEEIPEIDIIKELTFIDKEHEGEDLENTDLSNFNYEL